MSKNTTLKKITRNQIKDINRTKYAQEISSKIKDVNIIAMNKKCRAHQNRMSSAHREFYQKKRKRRKGGKKSLWEIKPSTKQVKCLYFPFCSKQNFYAVPWKWPNMGQCLPSLKEGSTSETFHFVGSASFMFFFLSKSTPRISVFKNVSL